MPELTQQPSGISRRTLMKGAAWAVPAIAVVSAAPAYATSVPPAYTGALYESSPNVSTLSAALSSIFVPCKGGLTVSQGIELTTMTATITYDGDDPNFTFVYSGFTGVNPDDDGRWSIVSRTKNEVVLGLSKGYVLSWASCGVGLAGFDLTYDYSGTHNLPTPASDTITVNATGTGKRVGDGAAITITGLVDAQGYPQNDPNPTAPVVGPGN